MSFFQWEQRYALGFESIDEDHKVLVGLINELFESISKGEGNKAIQSIVLRLVEYGRTHFKREEFFMHSINYIETLNHTSQHDEFIKKIDGFMEKLDAGMNQISVEVITFLRDWLINHILNTDKKFVMELLKHNLQ